MENLDFVYGGGVVNAMNNLSDTLITKVPIEDGIMMDFNNSTLSDVNCHSNAAALAYVAETEKCYNNAVAVDEAETENCDFNVVTLDLDETENCDSNVPTIDKVGSETCDSTFNSEAENEVFLANQNSTFSARRKRKNVTKPDEWNRSKAKMNRMNGETYLGFRRANPKSTNKILQDVHREARVIGPPCNSPVCKRWKNRLCDSVTQEQRHRIFHDFWKNMSWDSKKMYVCSTVDIKETKQKTTAKDCSRRNSSFFYHLKLHNKTVPVCREMYLRTLGLKKSEVHYWLINFRDSNMPSLKGKGDHLNVDESEDEEVVYASDEPMLKTNPPKLVVKKRFEQQLQTMTNFFDTLPTLPSHYCRKNSNKLFLQTDIKSCSHLYDMYKINCQDISEAPLSRFTFDKMKRKKNIEIFIPKKDRCDTCSSFEHKQVSEETYKKHLARKEAARAEKMKDKDAAQNGKCHTLCCDLMAVQTVPHIRASSAYYKLKLATHNFTVYNMASHDAMAYWFDETQASLASSTFASCLCDYVSELLDDSLKTVVIYSDGCCYQNRNAVLSNALLHLSVSKKVTIMQKYLVCLFCFVSYTGIRPP